MLHTFGFNFFMGDFLFLQVVRILYRLRAVKRRARIAAEHIGRYVILAVHGIIVLRHFDYLFVLLFRLIRFTHRLSVIFFRRCADIFSAAFEV